MCVKALNSTYIYKPSSDSGLSTGAIIGILIPSLLAVGWVGAYAAIARGSRPPIQYNNTSYTIILGLSLSSIIYLIIITFKLKFMFTELIIGIMLLIVGVLLANVLSN